MAQAPKSIGTRIIDTKPVRWQGLVFLQDDDFKSFPAIERDRLRNSIINNEFAQPFYVWQDLDGTLYCLDGKHRALMLSELIREGLNVPETLPATFIECRDRQDAAKMVLLYSSHYATVTQDGFIGFIGKYDLSLPELNAEISIPNLAEDYPVMPGLDELEGEGKSKPAVMRITFASPEQLESATGNIQALLESYPGAFFSVSCGEI